MQHAFSGGETWTPSSSSRPGSSPWTPSSRWRISGASSRPEATTNGAAFKKAFLKDVKKHVDAIASKYIRTDEGTFDFALMYIPAENVYYETIIKDDESAARWPLFNYALGKRVIPVSPNSFYAYLQTILLGLKGLRIEESARDMLNQLAACGKEFDRFEEAFRLVGKHLENSQTSSRKPRSAWARSRAAWSRSTAW